MKDYKEKDYIFQKSQLFINRAISKFSGHWPYMSKTDKFVRQIIFLIFLILSGIPEIVAICVQCGKDRALCAENISGTVFCGLILIKYIVPIIERSKFELFYQKIIDYWSSITDIQEKRIMNKIAKSGNMKFIFYMSFVLGGGILYCQVSIVPPLMDYFIPLNETRQRLLLVNAVFPFDPYEHYYKLYIFYNLSGIVNFSTILSSDSTFMVIVHQSCSLFAITKYRLEKTKCLTDSEEVHKEILSAIRLHQQALEFFDHLSILYKPINLLYIGGTIIFISFGSITVFTRLGSGFDFARAIFFELAFLNHLFFASYHGQMMIDHTETLFYTIYATHWYKMPLKTKKLVHIMMMRCKKPCILTAGGVYIMDMKNFGSIVKTILSYVAVAYEFQ